MRFRLAVCAWGAWLVAGCGPYIDEVVKERGPRVEQKLAQVRALGEELGRAPLLDKDEPADIRASFNMKTTTPDAANAALIYAEDLRELDELGLVYARVDGSSIVNKCSAFVHTEREPWDPLYPSTPPASGMGYGASRHFDVCEKLDFLLVLRTRAFARPSVGRASTTSGGRPEFDGGFVDADLLVFDVAQKHRVGGFRVQAESDEKLDGATEVEVEFDLRWNLEKAVLAGLKKHMPNVTAKGGPS